MWQCAASQRMAAGVCWDSQQLQYMAIVNQFCSKKQCIQMCIETSQPFLQYNPLSTCDAQNTQPNNKTELPFNTHTYTAYFGQERGM